MSDTNALPSNYNELTLRGFIGIVKDIDDPMKLGRVRVSVIGHHDISSNIETDDLPWAIPLLPVTSQSTNGFGQSPTGLAIGSYVMGFWMDNRNKRIPVIWGSYMKLPDNSQAQNEVPDLAREINSLQRTLVGPEPANPYAAKYPQNQVIKTAAGHIIELDNTPGAERINIQHRSGSYYQVGPDGTQVIKSTKDSYDIVVANKHIYVGGTATIVVKGDCNVTVGGATNLNSTGTVTVTAPEVDINVG